MDLKNISSIEIFLKTENKVIIMFIFASDFETRLYLCHGGFEFISNVHVSDLMNSFLIPFYLAAQLYYLIVLLKYGFLKLFKYDSYNTVLRKDLLFLTGKNNIVISL